MTNISGKQKPIKLKAERLTKEHSRETKLTPQERYKLAIEGGLELNAFLLSSKGGTAVFPKDSVGRFLHTKGADLFKQVHDYYSRRDIQQAIHKYAAGRKITFLRLFQPQYEHINRSEDVLPLTLCTLFERGSYWPSLHGTVSRYAPKGGRMCDAVIEIDYKGSWKKCFEMTRPVVEMLENRGAVFRLKFSGHCSVHIIIPAEVLQIEGFSVDHSRFFRCLSDLLKGELSEPRYLDTSFHMPDHFLRLAYSVNESTGLVSLPFRVEDYDSFDPDQAKPNNVKPIPGWWSIPENSSQRMQDFIKYVMRGSLALSSRAVQLPSAETETTTGWHVDRKLANQARLRKRQAAREFLPNEGFYDRMIRIGQDIIDLREFLLLEDQNSKTALRTLRRLQEAGQRVDLSSTARKFDVDEADLKLLWNWEQKERAFRYYARDDIKQAIYAHAEGRKIRVGNEDKLVFLQEPVDIMPLIVYSHLGSNAAHDEYPVIYSTNSKYERTGRVTVACDLKIGFSTKGEDEDILEAAMPVISLLSGFGLTFFMLFDGARGPAVIIPYEALPGGAKLASVTHDNALAQISKHLKRSMRMPGAACTLVRDPHALSLMPYSIHPKTGLACIPIELANLQSFSLKDAWLGNVQVDNEWWNIPEDAGVATANFLKQMAPLA